MDNTQDNTEQTFAPTTEQTFGEYESTGEMTQMESSQEAPRGASSSVDSGAKKSSNKMIYIGGGVAALLVVGFLMFGGNKGGQNTTPQAKPAPVAQKVAPEPKVEPVVKDEPVAPVQEAVVPVEANVSAPTTPVVPAPETISPVEANVSAPTTPAVPVPVVKTAISPSSDMEEIKEMLIEQKSSIDDLVRRVEALEGKPASAIGGGDVSGVSLDAKPVVKKKKKIAKKSAEPAMAEIISSGSDVNGEFLFNNPNKTVKTKSVEKTLTQYRVHSMYGSRFWMVKPDGTQGSYAVGDRLPFGEVVESIDLDAGKIKTSGGSIYTK